MNNTVKYNNNNEVENTIKLDKENNKKAKKQVETVVENLEVPDENFCHCYNIITNNTSNNNNNKMKADYYMVEEEVAGKNQLENIFADTDDEEEETKNTEL